MTAVKNIAATLFSTVTPQNNTAASHFSHNLPFMFPSVASCLSVYLSNGSPQAQSSGNMIEAASNTYQAGLLLVMFTEII